MWQNERENLIVRLIWLGAVHRNSKNPRLLWKWVQVSLEIIFFGKSSQNSWVGGWVGCEIYPIFFWIFGIFLTLQSPLGHVERKTEYVVIRTWKRADTKTEAERCYTKRRERERGGTRPENIPCSRSHAPLLPHRPRSSPSPPSFRSSLVCVRNTTARPLLV